MSQILIGIMGPGEQANSVEQATAFALGQAIARAGWILLTGGRNAGVMEAASQGARSQGGSVIGILPGETTAGMSSAVDIPILTGMGQARNVINILSSRVVIACGIGPGTLSEIAFARKLQKPLILMHTPPDLWRGLQQLDSKPLFCAETVDQAIAQVHYQLAGSSTL